MPTKGRGARKGGRKAPVRYSWGLASRICERIGRGEAWAQMARGPRMPATVTLYRWRDRYPDFAEMLRQAREAQADCWAEEALAVAEGATDASLSRDKVRISTRLALATRADRSRARDGAGGGAPRRVELYVRDFAAVRLADGRLIARERGEDGQFIDAEPTGED